MVYHSNRNPSREMIFEWHERPWRKWGSLASKSRGRLGKEEEMPFRIKLEWRLEVGEWRTSFEQERMAVSSILVIVHIKWDTVNKNRKVMYWSGDQKKNGQPSTHRHPALHVFLEQSLLPLANSLFAMTVMDSENWLWFSSLGSAKNTNQSTEVLY